jgi:hypothetical protein
MFIEFINTGDALKESGVTTNINQRVKYSANTASILITTAGSVQTILTAAGNGTLIKTITIQAIANTIVGRLYLFESTNTVNLGQIPIPAVVVSSTQKAFEITYELDYYLKAGLSLGAYLNVAQSFVVSAEGLDMSY